MTGEAWLTVAVLFAVAFVAGMTILWALYDRGQR